MAAGRYTILNPSLFKEPANFTLGPNIGEGVFGQVYLAYCDGVPVACKAMDSSIPGIAEVFNKEVEIMRKVAPSRWALQAYATKNDCPNDWLVLITEYMPGGDLRHFLDQNMGNIRWGVKEGWIRNLCCGIRWLHDLRIIHRDIKTDNIFIDGNGVAKIGDYGAAIEVDGSGICAGSVGTPYYWTPEMVNKRHSKTTSDVWALGVMLEEIITELEPYCIQDPATEQELYDHVLAGTLLATVAEYCDPHFSPDMPDAMRARMQSGLAECFEPDPDLRISAGNLLIHLGLAPVQAPAPVVVPPPPPAPVVAPPLEPYVRTRGLLFRSAGAALESDAGVCINAFRSNP